MYSNVNNALQICNQKGTHYPPPPCENLILEHLYFSNMFIINYLYFYIVTNQ
jgi:hypothetical protein